MAENIVDRRYRPSGRVDWALFAGWYGTSLVLAYGLGAALTGLWHVDLYYLIVTPFVLLAIWVLLFYVAIIQGKCRSPLTAAVAGIVGVLVFYFGHAHSDYLVVSGIESAGRLDLMVDFLIERIHQSALDGRVDESSQWLALAAEAAVLSGLAAFLGYFFAGSPFSETHHQWMHRVTVNYPSGYSRKIGSALDSGSTQAEALGLLPHSPGGVSPCAQLAVYLLPDDASPLREREMYMEFSEISNTASPLAVPMQRIDPDAVAVLVGILPILARDVVDQSLAEKLQLYRSRALWQQTPADYHGLISTPAVRILEGMAVMHTILVGMPLLVVACVLLNRPEWVGMERQSVLAPALFFGCAGFGWLFLGGKCYKPHDFMLRRAKAYFSQRPVSLFDRENPDVLFAEVSPRHDWNRLEWTREVGCLWIDLDRNILLYEGDRSLYAVPAGSFTQCRMETSSTASNDPDPTTYAVVRCLSDSGELEIPILVRSYFDGRPVAESSADRAAFLVRNIQRLQTP